jgi:diguanylate cyclase (GGDEF)-like protein
MVTLKKVLKTFGKYILLEIDLKGNILKKHYNDTNHKLNNTSHIKQIFCEEDQKHVEKNIKYKNNISNILRTSKEFGNEIVELKVSRKWNGRRYILVNFGSIFSNMKMVEQGYMEALIKESRTDLLTQVWNRRGGWKKILDILRSGRKPALGVMFVDIDKLKEINDGQGHIMGDKAIKQIADLLKTTTRRNDTVIRYGGDEFLVIVEENSKERSASRGIANRVLKEVQKKGYLTQVSIGLHLVETKGFERILDKSEKKIMEKWEEQILLADEAVYEAKEAGRSTLKTTVSFDKYFGK